jgi:hypothetical protein
VAEADKRRVVFGAAPNNALSSSAAGQPGPFDVDHDELVQIPLNIQDTPSNSVRMPQADGPIVDAQNPCYCPETTAGQFIERLFARDDHAPVLVSTFAQILDDQSASFNLVEQEQDKSPAPWLDSSGDTSGSSASLVADPAGGTGRRVNRTDLAFAADLSYGGLSSISSGEESEESMSSSVSQYLGELGGSDIHAQSDLCGDDASYDIEGKATQIQTFFPPRSGYSSPFPPHSAPRVAADQRVHVLEGSSLAFFTHITSHFYPCCT